MSRKVFYPTPTLPLLRGGSKKFTNDLGLLYILHDKAYSSRRIQQNQSPHMARMNNKAKANRIMLTDITEILTFRRV